jgi:putative membrane protein
VTHWLPAVPLLLAVGVLAAGVRRLHRRGDRWPRLRTAAAAAGLALVAAGLLPPLATAHDDPRLHMVQHVLVAMAGPLLLALGAPVTLALRAVRTPTRRRLLALLGSRPVRVLTWPPVVLALDVGGLYLLYLGGLAEHAEHVPWLHALVHAHLIAAGWLFAVVVAGTDPMPRPGVPARLGLVVLAGAAHDVLAKLLYARGYGDGAQIMYYAGGLADVALATAVLARWYAAGGRELARAARRRTPLVAVPGRIPAEGR